MGWLYLATVIDAHSRRVIGWAVTDHMRASLVTDALTMAIVQRGRPVAGVIFHSDRGVQGGLRGSAQSLEEFAARGLARAKLDVDAANVTDALRLYRKAGMTDRPSFTIWTAPL
jgi:transposase InsO family protein